MTHIERYFYSFVLQNILSFTMSPAMILKIFDSLTPLDQLLLKCASVLGEIINRNMLQYLMENKSTREIALGKNISSRKMQILYCNNNSILRRCPAQSLIG